MKFSHLTPRAPRPVPVAAFTMIEIAMALAIIGFAMVAIIGVLPMGMDVQKNNRRETIVNQDANYFIEAIRNGARGLDDLTNYVAAITIFNGLTTVSYVNPNPAFSSFPLPNPLPNQQALQLTSGQNIIGLLSTPKYTAGNTNYVVAYVQAISGAAVEKAPQTNGIVRAAGFSYRLVPEIVPYGSSPNTYFDSVWTNYNDPNISGNTNLITARRNYSMVVSSLNANLYDVRLLFRWPLLPGTDAAGLPKIGNGRQVYRVMTGGSQSKVNFGGAELYFFQSQTFTNAP